MKWLAYSAKNKSGNAPRSIIADDLRGLWQTIRKKVTLLFANVQVFMTSYRTKAMKRWLSLNVYTQLSNVPTINFMRACDDGSVKHLYKGNKIKHVEQVKEMFELMVDEYMAVIGDKKYDYYKKQQQEIIKLKYNYANVMAALTVLKHKRSDKMLDVLKSYNMIKKDAVKITNDDTFKITAMLKKWVLDVKIIETNLKNMFDNDNKPSTKKTNVEQAALDYTITLSKWQGYKVDLNIINAMEFAQLHKRYNDEIESIKKQNQRYGR